MLIRQYVSQDDIVLPIYFKDDTGSRHIYRASVKGLSGPWALGSFCMRSPKYHQHCSFKYSIHFANMPYSILISTNDGVDGIFKCLLFGKKKLNGPK